MDLNPGSSDISDYKTQFDRYSSCVKDIAAPEVHRVFTWLYQGGEKYVGEYMKDIPGSMIGMNVNEKKKLENKIPTEEMDITMLYRFLRYTCGLSKHDDDIWNKPHDESQKRSLEHCLYQLKQKRNKLAHEDQNLKKMSDDELIAKMNEVKELCNIILKEAGNKSYKSQDAALALIELEENFQRTMGVTAPLLAKLGRKEKEATNQLDMDFYVSPILTYKRKYLPLADIFTVSQVNDTQKPIIFLTGDAGSGKSTLCEYLDWQWTKDKEEIQELQEYDLLLLVRCREVCTGDVIWLLKEDLLPRTMECCNPYRIPKLIQSLKILWIIDGLEEATREANFLIHRLLSKDTYSSHSFLLASRPEFMYSIMQDLKQHEYTEVTLNGINPKESFQSMVKSSQMNTDTSDLERFTSNFESLDKNIQFELQNPLKLRVAIQFWSKTNRNSFKDSSLTELYRSLEESQIESLAKKLTGGMVTKIDATRKVKRWYDYLCQNAFELAAAKYILIINNATLDKLRRKCDELQIVLESSVCLSEFLTSNGQGKYQFLHPTQQYYFAAKYAAEVWKASNGKTNTMNLFDILQKGTPQNNIHFYEILLHMVSILQGSLDAVQVSNLIRLFQYTIDEANATPKWFEVIRKANYHKFFLKTISDIIPERWFVSDQNIKEACRLIKYKQPEHVAIKLDNDPKNSGVEDLLETLAKAKSWIVVELYLEYHCRFSIKDESDRLLRILSQKSSKCCILGFSGHLNSEGYKILNMIYANKYCKVLRLKVSSPQSLSTMYYHITKYELLANLQLTLTFLNYSKVNINSNTPTFKNTIVDLHLYNLIDSQVQNSVKCIKNLGTNFNSITVYKLSQSGAAKIVRSLQNKVKSNTFLRHFVNEDKMVISLTNFGPLPLPYEIDQFLWAWVHFEKSR